MVENVDGYKRIYINGTRTIYMVSESGDVISTKKQIRHLKIFETRPKKNKKKQGYLYVKLWINGKTKGLFIHRLVAQAYIPNPDNKPEVNHKDGDKHNNCVHNLEWCTSKENKEHAKNNNLIPHISCENMGRSKYTNKSIHKVCRYLEKNTKTISEISSLTGVDKNTIYGIRTKGIWHDISSKYNIPEKQISRSKTYTEKDIHRVCKYLETGMDTKEITKKTGVKKSTVNDILKHRRWVHISKKYKF